MAHPDVTALAAENVIFQSPRAYTLTRGMGTSVLREHAGSAPELRDYLDQTVRSMVAKDGQDFTYRLPPKNSLIPRAQALAVGINNDTSATRTVYKTFIRPDPLTQARLYLEGQHLLDLALMGHLYAPDEDPCIVLHEGTNWERAEAIASAVRPAVSQAVNNEEPLTFVLGAPRIFYYA